MTSTDTTSDKPDEFLWPTGALPPPPSVSDAIRQTCTAGLRPKKPIEPLRRVFTSVMVSGGLFVTLLAIGWMRHPPEDAIVMAVLGALAWGLIQASVVFVGHGRPPGLRSAKTLRWAAVLIVPAIFFVHLTLTTGSVLTFDQFLVAPRSVRSTVVCGIHALLFGAWASIALFGLWRRTDPFHPRLTGALTGLAGGLVGAVALDMTCTNDEAWHLWLGHGATLIVFVLAGWLAGRRWIAP